MKKSVVLISILVIAIFLTGCGKTQTAQNITSGSAYIGGTDGLSVSFVENAPPSVVYDKPSDGSINPFDINVRIENKGEFDVVKPKCVLKITGIDPVAFGKTSTDFRQEIKEDLLKTKRSGGTVIPGTFTVLSIPNLAYGSAVSGQVGPFNLRASICYEYKTEASSNICVLKDLLGTTRREGLCKPTETKSVENSGGPVKIDKLEQSVSGKDSLAFTFTIKHVGDKKNVVFMNEDQGCKMDDMQKQDKVKVQVLLGTADITSSCSGINSGVANLYADTGAQVRCTQTLSTTREDFVQPVKIIMSYDYYQYVDKQITVRQVGT